MKAILLDKNGKKAEDITLEKEIFGVRTSDSMLLQYLRTFRANMRQGTSSTKTRSEVSGSGAKPWSQKGTGRARVGSKRNPIWTHGGISHGPKPKNWNIKMPQSYAPRVLKAVLSDKLENSQLMVVDGLKYDKPNTKGAFKFLNEATKERRVLLITTGSEENLIKSFRNLNNVVIKTFKTLNAYDVLSSNAVIFLKDALTEFHKRYKVVASKGDKNK